MNFQELNVSGVYKVDLDKKHDDRGFFVRSWDKLLFHEHGLNANLIQCNISFNKIKGTIRGLHYQDAPYAETKFVMCVRGKAHEVFVDLRQSSKTYLKYGAIVLNSKNLNCLYVPEGIALGFQTLEDDTALLYQMSELYKPDYSHGIIWNDKTLNIKWPIEMTIISKKDSNLPNLIDVFN